MTKKFFLSGLAVIGVMILLPAAVNAQSGRTSESQERQTTSRKTADERRNGFQSWRTDEKLKLCERREKVIATSMARLSDRSQKQFELFTTIATRTEDFYARKGKVLANYDALVAEVNAKKAAVQTIIDNEASNNATFSCSGDNPREIIRAFNDQLRAKIQALKEYKVAIKNLIVGVKSVQGITSSTENKNRGGSN